MALIHKIKETIVSVVPIMVLVLILNFTAAPLSPLTLLRFLIGGIFTILGLSLFLLGADIGIIPIGEKGGAALTSKKNLPLFLCVSFAIGFIITFAEPDVQVLAQQVQIINPAVNSTLLVAMISIGVGLFVSIGLLRTVLQIPIKLFFLIFYVLLFAAAFFTPSDFLSIAFDAGGATTGPMTVPFILALGMGVAAVHGGKNNHTDSFGLTGLVSIGPIIAVIILGIIMGNSNSTTLIPEAAANPVLGHIIPEVFVEVSKALLPLIILFILFQLFLIKMPPKQIIRMSAGLIYSFLGLILFLTGVKYGFMPAGTELGAVLGKPENAALLILVGAIMGAVVVCAEPAVWVLTHQVEHISGGSIKRKTLLTALAFGVSLSIALSMIRVTHGFSIWFYLIPGYTLALLLMVFCPKMYTAIAFDSGGVASGPMTSTFILSFTLGASLASGGNPVTDAFGVIAMVAMTPLIAIQILGILSIKRGKHS